MAAIFTTVLLVGLAGVIVPAVGSPSPAGAVEEEFSLSLVEGGGVLAIRDAEEPYLIEQPTTLSGDVDTDTGVISGASFSTPTVSFEFPVESPPATAFIDATFTEVSPGTASGAVDSEGNLIVELALTVNLHIEVVATGTTQPFLTGDCVASPVNLQLDTVEPYDPSRGEVTVADDFEVPAVASSADCDVLLVGPINDALEGGGHLLVLTLAGDLTLPPEAGEPSVTTLEVVPEGGVAVGDTVTMTATVEADEDAEPGPDPIGFVDFSRGSTVLATVALTGGVAEFETALLPVGTHSLTARYRGDSVYRSSTSDAIVYQVAARPLVSADLPEFVEVGGGAVEFDVMVTNTGHGSGLENARLDVTFQRTKPVEQGGTSPNGPLAPATGDEAGDRVVVSLIDGENVDPVALTSTGSGANQRLHGGIGAPTGVAIPPGSTHTERLRLELPDVGVAHPTACGNTNKTCPGMLQMTIEVVPVDPITGEPVPGVAPASSAIASTAGITTIIEAERRPTTVALGRPGFPPFLPAVPPVQPHTIRQGGVLDLFVQEIEGRVGNVLPTGLAEILLDGQPVAAADAPGHLLSEEDGYQLPPIQVVPSTSVRYQLALPPDILPGTHELTFRYLGDAVYLPSQASAPFDVLLAAGPLYDCTAPGATFDHHFRASLVAQANVPAVREAGSEVALGNFELELLLDRGPSVNPGGRFGQPTGLTEYAPPEHGIELTFGPSGTGTAPAADWQNAGSKMSADPVGPANPVDGVFEFVDETGSVVIDGEPGEVVPVTVDEIVILRTSNFNIPTFTTCVPLGEPKVLGEVTIAGTTLSASASSIQPGESVTLTADVAPAGPGIVVFRDGGEEIEGGVVPVSEASASFTVDDLAIGSHEFTAQFFPNTLGVPVTTSNPVTVTVIDSEPAFSDVPEDSMFFMDIQWLAQAGITTGFEDGTFQPAAAINRDAVAAWLWRYAGEPVVDIEQQFSDVPPEHPFYDAIQWMADVGITTGFENGTFQPASAVSRDAVAAWLWRFAGEPESTLLEPAFSDVPVDHPFYLAVQWLAETEITTGFPDGTFQPAAEIERQAVAAWLFRLAQL